jgi:predicted RNA methylase
MEWGKTFEFGGVRVCDRDDLEGGGATFGQDYLPLFDRLCIPKQRRIFEWCAGPACIGYSLLGHGKCETLCLADINPDAVLAARTTAERNGLTDRVNVYLSDNLDSIPTAERWDMAVGNPPHYFAMNETDFADRANLEMRAVDKGWALHRRFYREVGKFLVPGGIALIQENNFASTPTDFYRMIRDAGLRIVFNVGGEARRTKGYNFYFLGVARMRESLPEWVVAAAKAHPPPVSGWRNWLP